MAFEPLSEMNEGATGFSDVGAAKKRMSVERIYQRKTQLEHILLRPDTYIGSVEEATQTMWVWDAEKEAIVNRSITFVPGLYKIFDEILVNAADNKQRDPKMNAIKIVIDPENNVVSIWNNGKGIPVEMHAVEKMYVPELIFGTLLTSSNYNDEQRKVTGGRNGYGAKLCNIFSTEFTIETACSDSNKLFKQTWKNNMGAAGKHSVTSSSKDYTKVTFKPDLSKFKMTHLDHDMVALMTRRAYDIAGTTKGVTVYLNGNKLPVKCFKDYVQLYLKGQEGVDEEEEIPRKVVHEVVGPRWEVCVTASNAGFKQASFVNSIATTKGGTHVSLVVDQLVAKLLEISKKKNKGGMELKPYHIKNHIWVFINCQVENPTFDSQTKENLTLKAKSFGSTCSLSDKFIKQAVTCGIVERVLSWARVKSQVQLSKKQSGSKHSKLRGIPKLDDANDAGGKNSTECTLIVTEGDSAKSLAVSGLGVIGRDRYGVFPLKGKMLNVREASHNQLMGNEEIKNLIKILGLQYGKKYLEVSDLRGLRYGRLMIMADQDQDGSHIKGLVINFIHHNWPRLLQHGFVEEFITPLVKVSKGREEIPFFSLPEFERWQAQTANHKTWRVKYYKGLGTSTSKEAKEYFSDMDRHRIHFQYVDDGDDHAIELAFSKKLVNERKEWLTSWLQHRRERRSAGMNESYLYAEATDSITFSDFVNKELILFSNMDNERSIPSMVDGLKPGQRKVLFTCFKRNDKKEIKVAQLAGSVAEHSAYHHGEQSLMGTIINLAQNFVGSNNVNLLQPLGQFGTRLHGGKDAASPRYIFTMLSPLARKIFPPPDDWQLVYNYEDNSRIEPEWYCPILPMVLVNGSEGIGTGYSTFVPNYNPREIVANLMKLMSNMEPTVMQPWYKNFTGTIAHVEPHKYMVYGNVARLSDTSLEITELPIRAWTQNYKENVLEPMLHGTEKAQPFIMDYKEYHTDTTVRFVVSLTHDKMEQAVATGLHKKFKLETSMSTSNLVLFDRDCCLKKYENEMEILREFYDVRLDTYCKRKEWLVSKLEAEASRLSNQARFIMEKIEGKLVLEGVKRKTEMIKILQERGYTSDPVKAWKETVAAAEQPDEGTSEDEKEEKEASKGPDYNYLMGMAMWNLIWETAEELLNNRDKKVEELRILKEKTPKDLWKEDLDGFLEELDRVEELERQEELVGASITVKRKKGPKGGRQAKMTASGALAGEKSSMAVTKPSPFAEIIAPVIPEFVAEKPKKEKTALTKKKKIEDPSQSTLNFAKAESDDKTTTEECPEPKKEQNVFDILGDDNIPSLSERVKNTPPSKTKQAALLLKKPAPAKPKSKTKVSDSDGSGSDMDVPASPRKRAHPTRTKAVKSYAIDLDSDEEEEEIQGETRGVSDDDEFKLPGQDSSEDGLSPPPKKTSKLTFTTISHQTSKQPKANAKPKAKAAATTKSSKAGSKTGSKQAAKADSKPTSETEPQPVVAKATVPKKSAGTKKADSKPKGKAAAKQPQKTLKQMMEPVNKDTEESSLTSKPKSKAAVEQSQKTVFDLTESDEFKDEPPRKKPAGKPRGRPKQKAVVQVLSSGSEEEATEPVPKKSVPKPKEKVAPKRPQKAAIIDSSDEEETQPVPTTKSGIFVQPKDKTVSGRHQEALRRPTKRVKYTFSDSEEEEWKQIDSDDDSFQMD